MPFPTFCALASKNALAPPTPSVETSHVLAMACQSLYLQGTVPGLLEDQHELTKIKTLSSL